MSEHRPDRAYDDQGPSTVVHPNGTLMATFDRALSASLVRHVLAIRQTPA